MSHENTLVNEALGPYSLRTNTDAEVAVLLAEPEIILPEAEQQVAAEFAHALMDGSWQGVTVAAKNPKTGEPMTYGEVDKLTTATNKHTYYFKHLGQPANADLRQQLGIEGLDQTLWASTISKHVAEGATYDQKALRAGAKASKDWHDGLLDRALTQPDSNDVHFRTPDSFTINFTPEKLLQKAEGWQAYRQYYREQRHKAINAASRLYRFNGVDSQPLDYSLQELIVNSLQQYDPKMARAVALGASSFALLDAANLHRVGMYNLPDPDKLPSSAEVVLKVFKESFLPQLMADRQAKA